MKDGFTFWHGVFCAGALITAVALFVGIYTPSLLGVFLMFCSTQVLID